MLSGLDHLAALHTLLIALKMMCSRIKDSRVCISGSKTDLTEKEVHTIQ